MVGKWVDVPLGRLEQYQRHIDPVPPPGRTRDGLGTGGHGTAPLGGRLQAFSSPGMAITAESAIDRNAESRFSLATTAAAMAAAAGRLSERIMPPPALRKLTARAAGDRRATAAAAPMSSEM